MDRIMKERLVDRSDQEQFRFTLNCAVCGHVWESTARSKSGKTYAQALNQAYQEAAGQFAVCRLCADPVCGDCQVTMGEMTVCGTCAGKMKL